MMHLPWLPHAVRMLIDGYLTPGMKIFEWGSGGSTLYFLNKGCDVVSVEHNEEWYNEVMKCVPSHSTLEIHLVLPDSVELGSGIGNPHHYKSSCVPGNFRQYALVIDQYLKFDLVLVDGRARPSCLMHSKSHVADGGLLILDNYDRSWYMQYATEWFGDWEGMKFYGHGPPNEWLWDTICWRNVKCSVRSNCLL